MDFKKYRLRKKITSNIIFLMFLAVFILLLISIYDSLSAGNQLPFNSNEIMLGLYTIVILIYIGLWYICYMCARYVTLHSLIVNEDRLTLLMYGSETDVNRTEIEKYKYYRIPNILIINWGQEKIVVYLSVVPPSQKERVDQLKQFIRKIK